MIKIGPRRQSLMLMTVVVQVTSLLLINDGEGGMQLWWVVAIIKKIGRTLRLGTLIPWFILTFAATPYTTASPGVEGLSKANLWYAMIECCPNDQNERIWVGAAQAGKDQRWVGIFKPSKKKLCLVWQGLGVSQQEASKIELNEFTTNKVIHM